MEDTNYVRKHLARNVPTDFSLCCERVRLTVFSSRKTARARLPAMVRTHREMMQELSEQPFSDGEAMCISEAIDEVQVRFLAIQKTLDQSVPAKPVHMALKSLLNTLGKTIDKLEDPDRDVLVEEMSQTSKEYLVGSLEERFDQAHTLAAKTAILHQHLKATSEDLAPILDFFDYKGGLVTKGQPSKYSVFYAVSALADLFERTNTRGLKARVNEFDRGHDPNDETLTRHERRYTGRFLTFARRFFSFVVPEQCEGRSFEAFAEQIRKYASARTSDPELHKIMEIDPVSVEGILEFMKRADEAK